MKGRSASAQPDFQLHSLHFQLESRDVLLYKERCNIVGVIYKDAFNVFSIKIKLLSKFIKEFNWVTETTVHIN